MRDITCCKVPVLVSSHPCKKKVLEILAAWLDGLIIMSELSKDLDGKIGERDAIIC